MKYLLRHIAGTQDLGVFYSRQKKGDNRLIGYSDSDHTGHVDHLAVMQAEGGGPLVMRGRRWWPSCHARPSTSPQREVRVKVFG